MTMTSRPASSTAAHVLIVDDDQSVRFFLAEELRLKGYQVTALGSGEEALAWLRQYQTDVVVLDLKMIGMDGLQVMAEIQSLPLSPVVIMLTAHGSLDAAVAAMRRGSYDFLRKPCSPEELRAAVERALARRRKEQQHEEMLQLIEETAHKLRALSTGNGPSVGQSSPYRSPLLEGRGILLDQERQIVTRCGIPLSLSPTEFRLLACLMAQPDTPVSFREMSRQVRGLDEHETVARDALRTTLWRLRQKLNRADDGYPYIVNLRGRGYMFVKKVPPI